MAYGDRVRDTYGPPQYAQPQYTTDMGMPQGAPQGGGINNWMSQWLAQYGGPPSAGIGIPDYLKYQNGQPQQMPGQNTPNIGPWTDYNTWLGGTSQQTDRLTEFGNYMNQQNTGNLNWATLFGNLRGQADVNRMQDTLNQHSMGLSDKEFALKQGLSQVAQDQWNQQFGFQGKQWNQQYALDQQKQALDEKYKAGLISNDQYQNETGRLTQQSQQNQWQKELAQKGSQFGQTLAQQNQQFRDTQTLDREKMGNDMTQSRYAAFGRATAPTARWQSSW